MANTASRIYPSGLLSVGGNLDEVTYNDTTPAIKNLFRNTEDFALWSTFNVSATSNVILAPNNFKTADLLTEAANSLTKEVNRGVTGLTIGSTYTISVYAKSNGRPNFRIAQSTDTFGSATNATFNLTTGTMVSYSGGYISASIVNIGDGWYRCIASFIPTRASGITSYLTLLDASNQSIYAGNGTSGMYFWGAQLELGPVATEYQGIGTSDGVLVPVPFAKKDNAAGLYTKGSFNEVTYNPSAGANAIVNILPYSQELNNAVWGKYQGSVVPNVAIAPDGTMTADKWVEDTASGVEHWYYKTQSLTNVTLTCSVYLKAAGRTQAYISLSNFINASSRAIFDIVNGTVLSVSVDNFDFINSSASIINCGNGWFRCVFTTTKLKTNNNCHYTVAALVGLNSSYTGDGVSGFYSWGNQIEYGSTVSDYQPTAEQNTLLPSNFAQRIVNNGSHYVKGNYDEVNKPHVVQNLLLNLDPSISPVTANTIRDTVDSTRIFNVDGVDLCDVSNPNFVRFNRSYSPKYGGGLSHDTSGVLTVPNFIYANHTWEIWVRINDINSLFSYNPSETLEQVNAIAVYNGYHSGFMFSSSSVFYSIWDGTSVERMPVVWTLGTTTGNVIQGNWYQLAVTRNGNTFAGYVNGVPLGTINNSFTYAINASVSNRINIGKAQAVVPGQSSYVYYSKTDFGGMRMYNRALSPAEVLQNFNANRSKFGI